MLITGVAKANPVLKLVWKQKKNKTIKIPKRNHGQIVRLKFAKTKESILNLFKSKKDVSQD